jgi:hypothetical protein
MRSTRNTSKTDGERRKEERKGGSEGREEGTEEGKIKEESAIAGIDG